MLTGSVATTARWKVGADGNIDDIKKSLKEEFTRLNSELIEVEKKGLQNLIYQKSKQDLKNLGNKE